MVFEVHGIFKVKADDKLLLVDARGPFNEELMLSYEADLELCIQQLEKSKWNQIIILRNLSLLTPEAEQAGIKSLINRKLRGLNVSAVVLIDIEGESLLKGQLNRIYQISGIKHQFFTSIQDARKWLLTAS